MKVLQQYQSTSGQTTTDVFVNPTEVAAIYVAPNPPGVEDRGESMIILKCGTMIRVADTPWGAAAMLTGKRLRSEFE